MLALALSLVLSAVPPEVVKQVEVRAVPSDVWRAWATDKGAKTFFAPDAKIEARPGGAYELYFDPEKPPGTRGSEGCKVVSAEPLKKLVFTWNFPPSLASLRDAKALTTVTVELFAQGKTTKVKLTQTGWKEGPDWEKGRAYFDVAWGVVLDRLAHRFRRGPLDWKKPWSPVRPQQLAFLEGKWNDPLEDRFVSFSQGTDSLTGVHRLKFGRELEDFPTAIHLVEGDAILEAGWLDKQLGGHRTLILDTIKPGDAVFVSECCEPVRVEYQLEKGKLEVWINLPRAEAHLKLDKAP
jgi:uncharacterized protein YndB with AHSA1/START domain